MARLYVGNLPSDIKESEIDDLFYKYGRIRDIELKTPARPPAFAFISFEDSRDAEDAVRGRDGYNFDGYRLRVEFAKGERRGGGYDDRDRDRDRRDRDPPRKGGGGRRTDYGVIVTNLPRGCSWQDLKDFMRKAGDVVFSDVDKYGEGVVEFSNRDDMEYAIRSLDDTEFKNHHESSYIRVKAARKNSSDRKSKASESRSRSRSRDRKRSYSRSRSNSRGRDRDSDSDAEKDKKKVDIENSIKEETAATDEN